MKAVQLPFFNLFVIPGYISLYLINTGLFSHLTGCYQTTTSPHI